MNKFLKLTGVSMLAVIATTNAHAAGYTCEELIEYTSCNTGYYLNAGKCLENTSCPAGNYLKATPPEISQEYPEDAWIEYGTTWCLYYEDEYWLADSQEECEAYDDSGIEQGTWYGEGFVYDSGDGQRKFVKELKAGLECTPCAAGTYQNAAGQYSCLTCPAGSYCGTMGLTAATLCTQGTYSMGGATECSQCPVTGLTDKNGATVVATTLSTGSTSPAACIVGEEYYFTDTKGTYHYKSDCAFKPWMLSVTTEAQCKSLNGDWEWAEDTYMCWSAYSDDPTPTTYVTTQEVCENDVGADAYWEDGVCYCNSPWLFDEYGLSCYM